ncbi:MAG: hypothetical protein LBV16_08225 [Elusimicrobiota bacterium]|jgi:Ca2+/Na+ antiporter|nr:hypothetical protein [Elusimicrobiota bacterium]
METIILLVVAFVVFVVAVKLFFKVLFLKNALIIALLAIAVLFLFKNFASAYVEAVSGNELAYNPNYDIYDLKTGRATHHTREEYNKVIKKRRVCRVKDSYLPEATKGLPHSLNAVAFLEDGMEAVKITFGTGCGLGFGFGYAYCVMSKSDLEKLKVGIGADRLTTKIEHGKTIQWFLDMENRDKNKIYADCHDCFKFFGAEGFRSMFKNKRFDVDKYVAEYNRRENIAIEKHAKHEKEEADKYRREQEAEKKAHQERLKTDKDYANDVMEEENLKKALDKKDQKSIKRYGGILQCDVDYRRSKMKSLWDCQYKRREAREKLKKGGKLDATEEYYLNEKFTPALFHVVEDE